MLIEEIMLILSLVVSIVMFVVGACFIIEKERVNTGKVLVLLGIVLIVLVAIFVGKILISLGHASFELGYDNRGFFVIMLLLFGALVVLFSASVLWKFTKKKIFYIPFCICTAVCLLVTCTVAAVEKYYESMPTMRENEFILFDYAPYIEGSKVAELDEESTLIITEDLPKLDGATAMYPVYSAIAKAVYPESLIYEYSDCTTTRYAYESIASGTFKTKL